MQRQVRHGRRWANHDFYFDESVSARRKKRETKRGGKAKYHIRMTMMMTMAPALPNSSLSSFAVDSDVSFGREMRKDPETDCEDDDIRVRRPVRALSSPTGPHLSITHMVDGTAISTDTRAATQ